MLCGTPDSLVCLCLTKDVKVRVPTTKVEPPSEKQIVLAKNYNNINTRLPPFINCVRASRCCG